MTDLSVAKKCDRSHGYSGNDVDETRGDAKASDEDIDKIVSRLYNTHTVSSRGDGEPPATARDTISRGKANKEEVNSITDRLYRTHTRAMKDHPDDQLTARDTISKNPVVSNTDLTLIVDRMYQTHTTSSGGSAKQPHICDNSIAKKVESNDEINEIFQRLQTTHTKSSSGGQECRPWDQIDQPGLGQKMLPPIDGLAKRFAGQNATSDDQVSEVTGRLVKTQTTASQARLDNPRILLYPERTTLCNNVERIRSFQESGSVVKQNVMERREKWFN